MIKKLFNLLYPSRTACIEYFSTHPLIFGRGFPQACLGSEGRISVKAGESTTLILGVNVHIPEGMTMMVLLKPGLCTSRGLVQDFPEMLPPGYRGNLRLRVSNRSARDSHFSPDSDIAVLIPLCGGTVEYVETPLRIVDPAGYNRIPEY